MFYYASTYYSSPSFLFFFWSAVYFSRSADTFIWSILRVGLSVERSALGWAVAVATKKEDFWYFSREQGNRTAGRKRTDYSWWGSVK